MQKFQVKSNCTKNFFVQLKNFPQEIENTREIIENISDIFFATYTPADFQVLGR